ncbi:uncharacterized protein A1O9_05304 [Exophiala aquamarina CBS 119918]|uniref:SB domain-containing protein n=1 Tax=Exophiala aquamarina CBS 119918 TaxID=1182545 RepID=A0A072PCA4_9EURO|nr:uncharacterized protein A1O9_05304 [Exophiala aquamarina CBS 119918]KEF57387.1 hypothetical protein A1O9_05304 [Exophiala aquamarina CBS 119918]
MSRTQQPQRQSEPIPPPVPPLPREIQPHPAPSPAFPSSQSPRASPGPPPPPPKDFAQSGPAPGPTAQRPGRYDAPPPLPSEGQPGRPGIPRAQPPYANGSTQRPPSGMNYMPQRTSSLRQSTPAQEPHSAPGYEPLQQQQYHPQPSRSGDSQQHQHPPTQQPLPAGQDPRIPARPHANNPPWQGPSPGSHVYSERPPPHQYSQSKPLPVSQHQYQQHQGPHYAQPQQTPYQQQPPQPLPQHQPKPAKAAPPPNLLDSPFDIPLPAPSNSTVISKNPNIPVPPIPVNPEKEALLAHLSYQVTQSLHQQISQSTSALPALSSQHDALQHTLQTLAAELTNLQATHSTLSSNLNLLSSSLAKSDKVISSAHARSSANDIPAVDEMLVPPTVVSRQLYDAACEERGIEAALLALQEGFVRGRIPADVWSRRTRELAREGFKRRWIERKVAKGMALDMGMLGNGV